LSLDFAEQGINTLWGSFEIKNTRLLHKLLQQFSREPLPVGKPEMVDSLNALADRFQTLPLYFMKFHGGSDVDDVLDAMDYAAYVHDVEHIILDNMQFMISRSSMGASKFDKFDVQDIAVEKFRKFATDRNVHVTLVVHPRKEEEGAKLGISSIYGSAKATQEADTVLILQNDGRRKYIEVKKNRFDGTLGYSPLHFQRSSGRYEEHPDVGPSTQTRASPVQAGTKMIQARMPTAVASTPYTDIDKHWDSMLEGTDE
jgi:twinkle protein